MARIRSIHPGLATDEDFVGMSRDARLLYVLLLTECDDQGVFEWKPTTLKMRLFPADNIDVAPLLSEMVAAHKVIAYEIDGRKFGAVRNFRKFQRPKSPNTAFPLPEQFRSYVGLDAAISEIGDDEPPPLPPKAEIAPQMEDGGWRMEDGEERTLSRFASEGRSRKVASRLDPEFAMPSYWMAEAEDSRTKAGLPPVNLQLEAVKFANYWQAKSGANATKLDWRKTWINWALRADGDANGRGSGKPNGSDARGASRNGFVQLQLEAERRAEARDRGRAEPASDG